MTENNTDGRGAGGDEAQPKPTLKDFGRGTRPLKRALIFGALTLVPVWAACLAAFWYADGTPGAWGALIGGLIGGGYILLTAVTVLLAGRGALEFLPLLVLGGFLIKIVLVIIAFAVLSRMEFYTDLSLAVTTIVCLVIVLAAELFGAARTRTPIVS